MCPDVSTPLHGSTTVDVDVGEGPGRATRCPPPNVATTQHLAFNTGRTHINFPGDSQERVAGVLGALDLDPMVVFVHARHSSSFL